MNRLQQIKYKRLSHKEKYLYDIMTNLEIRVSDDYPEYVFYTNNKKPVCAYNGVKNILSVSYSYFWNDIKTKYDLYDLDVRYIINKSAIQFLNLPKDVIVERGLYIQNISTFKLKEK